MKRVLFSALATAALMAASGLAGCDRQENTKKVDPRIDGLTPSASAVDPNIFEDQREIHKKTVIAPAPAPSAAPATAAAPAPESTTPAPEATPPTPPESATPGAPAPPPE